MAIIRCDKGHFYDDSKYMLCPHCQNGHMDRDGDDDLTRHLTEQAVLEEAAMLVRGDSHKYSDIDYDDDKTIGFFSPSKGNDFVTGWLVCVDGPEKGRDYKLHSGFNRIGRSRGLDIYLEEDCYISRSAHCAVVYEHKGNCFYLVPQGGNITYLNGNTLSGSMILKTGDIIEIGESKLEFVAFCRGERKWDSLEIEGKG